MPPCRLEHLEHDDIELMWMSDKFSTESWKVGLLFRPPSSNASYWVRLREAFQTVSMNVFDGGIVLGDFNVDANLINQSSPNRSPLFHIAVEFGLEQLVISVAHLHLDNPTAASIIDLVFSKRPHRFASVSTAPSPVETDSTLCVSVKHIPSSSSHSLLFSTVHRGDFDHLGRLIHLIPWSAFMDPNNINSSAEIFTDLLNTAICDSIPTTSRRRLMWITPELKKLINKKHKLFSRAHRSGLLFDWHLYKAVHNNVKYLTQKLTGNLLMICFLLMIIDVDSGL